ncbi:hypothetical protein DFH08DRAFT_820558 [Mycena albidolilacea]|uniref:Uncharacterized protein n=1 Tax=Mycena albidolilacea TaxID=1033008 RepID=A0AAD6ZBP8_9AGAR|nr:hypothetical protein DFH08DRAFT_820558 [Mycena albidolilacea]
MTRGWYNRSLKLSIQGTIGISKQETKTDDHPKIPSISHSSPPKSLTPLPIPASAMPSLKGLLNVKSIASISSAAASKLKFFPKTATRMVKAVLHSGKSRKLNASNDDANNESTNCLRSGVYQFFKSPVLHEDNNGHKYQFFECAAPKGCKHKAKGTT